MSSINSGFKEFLSGLTSQTMDLEQNLNSVTDDEIPVLMEYQKILTTLSSKINTTILNKKRNFDDNSNSQSLNHHQSFYQTTTSSSAKRQNHSQNSNVNRVTENSEPTDDAEMGDGSNNDKNDVKSRKRKITAVSSDSNKKLKSQLGLDKLEIKLLTKIYDYIGLNNPVVRLNHYFKTRTCGDPLTTFKRTIDNFSKNAIPLCASLQKWFSENKETFEEENLPELVSLANQLINQLDNGVTKSVQLEIDGVILKLLQPKCTAANEEKKQIILKFSTDSQKDKETNANGFDDGSAFILSFLKELLPVEAITSLMIDQVISLFSGLKGQAERQLIATFVREIPRQKRASLILSGAPLIDGVITASNRVICLAKIDKYTSDQRVELSDIYKAIDQPYVFGTLLIQKDIAQMKAALELMHLFPIKDKNAALGFTGTAGSLMKGSVRFNGKQITKYEFLLETLKLIPQNYRLWVMSYLMGLSIESLRNFSTFNEIPTETKEHLIELLSLVNDPGWLAEFKTYPTKTLEETIGLIKPHAALLSPAAISFLFKVPLEERAKLLKGAHSLYVNHPQKEKLNFHQILTALHKCDKAFYDVLILRTLAIIEEFYAGWKEKRGENCLLSPDKILLAVNKLNGANQWESTLLKLHAFSSYWLRECGGDIEDIIDYFGQVDAVAAQKAIDLCWSEQMQQNLIPILDAAKNFNQEQWLSLVPKANFVLINFSFISPDQTQARKIHSIKDFKFSGELLKNLAPIPLTPTVNMISIDRMISQIKILNKPISEEAFVVLVGFYRLQIMIRNTWTQPSASLLFLNLKVLNHIEGLDIAKRLPFIDFVEKHPKEYPLIEFFFPICEGVPVANYSSTLPLLEKWRSSAENEYLLKEKLILVPSKFRFSLIHLLDGYINQDYLNRKDTEDLKVSLLEAFGLIYESRFITEDWHYNIFKLFANCSPKQRRIFLDRFRKLSSKFRLGLFNSNHLRFNYYDKLFDLIDYLQTQTDVYADYMHVLFNNLRSNKDPIHVIDISMTLFEHAKDLHQRRDIMCEIGMINPGDREDVARKVKPYIEKYPEGTPGGIAVFIGTLSLMVPEERQVILDQAAPYLMKYDSLMTKAQILKSFIFEREASVDAIINLMNDKTLLFRESIAAQRDKLLYCSIYFTKESFDKFLKTFKEKVNAEANNIKTGPALLKWILQSNPALGNEINKYLLEFLQMTSHLPKVKYMANFITTNYACLNLVEEHPLVQEAIMKLAVLEGDVTDPKHPMKIHEKLRLMSLEAFPKIKLPTEKIGGRNIQINMDFILNNNRPRLQLTFSQFPKNFDFDAIKQLFEGLETRMSDKTNGEKLKKYVEGSMDKFLLSFTTLKGDFNDTYWSSLATVTGKPEEIALESYVRFCGVMNYISDQSHDLTQINDKHPLTQREDVLLKMVSSMVFCQKEEGLILAYNILPQEYRYLSFCPNIPIAQQGLLYLDEVMQKTLNNAFSNANPLLKKLTKSDPIDQLAHQAVYVKNALGPIFNLQQRYKFDKATWTLSDELLKHSLQNLAQETVDYAIPSLFIKELQTSFTHDQEENVKKIEEKLKSISPKNQEKDNAMEVEKNLQLKPEKNKEKDKEDNKNDKLYEKLAQVIPSVPGDQIWKYDATTFSTTMTEIGALELWLKIGYLIEK